MSDLAISVGNVSKRFKVFDSPRARLRHALLPGYRTGMQEIWALRDVSCEVERGESLGIIGRNGGGKSTLLEILTGSLAPTTGEVKVNGRVSALLELGSGFNPEYTGRDNVILSGLLLGLTRDKILRRFGEITDFAEIGEAVDRPVKTYSSGMLMRLAFAVQVLTDPDILIIDEALSAGDFFFQQKCFGRIRSMREKGVTPLFVSHDMGAVRDLCTKGLLLKNGRVRFWGRNLDAIRLYLSDRDSGENGAAQEASAAVHPRLREKELALPCEPAWAQDISGETAKKASIIAVSIDDLRGRAVTAAPLGSTIRFSVLYRPATMEPVHVTIALKNKYEQLISASGSYILHTEMTPPCPGEMSLYELELTLDIEAGLYSFSVSLGIPSAGERSSGELLDQTPWLGPLEVTFDYRKGPPKFLGMCGLPAKSRFVTSSAAPEA